MYCSSCAKELVEGLSFCNHCGQRLGRARDDGGSQSSEAKPLLVSAMLGSAMIGVFIFGLLAISILLGVMKRVDFDPLFLLIFTTFSFVLMLVIEGVLIRLLLSGKKAAKEVSDTNRLNEQSIKEIYAAPIPELSESTFQPISSVTEQTTRSLAYMPKNQL